VKGRLFERIQIRVRVGLVGRAGVGFCPRRIDSRSGKAHEIALDKIITFDYRRCVFYMP